MSSFDLSPIENNKRRRSSRVECNPEQIKNYLESQNNPKAIAKELQRKRREKKPFFYCRWVAHHPKRCFFTCLGLHLSLVFVTGVLIGVDYNVLPINFEKVPMELYNIPHRLRDLAFRARNNYTSRFSRYIFDGAVHTWDRGLMSLTGSVDIYFDADGSNIFTKGNLKTMKAFEEDMMTTEDYQKTWCMTYNASLACSKPISILRYFDGSYSALHPVFSDPEFENVSGVLYEAYTNEHTRNSFEYFLPKSYKITPTSAQADLTRSILPMGCSFTGDMECSNIRYYQPAKDFSVGPLVTKLEKWRKESKGFDMYYYSFVIWRVQVVKQAMKDILYAVGSMLFIFCFMAFHTRSLWVTFFAVLSILTSFLGANIIYRCVLGFEYFGFFHILAIFIILGIGADDLFVFYDSWRLTSFQSYPSLAHRLSDAYSKSTLSMFMTSLTTMVAFMCSAVSPLLATRSFGVFAGILVMYNYISVIIFFPTVVVVYHITFESTSWPCFRSCKKAHDTSEDYPSNRGSKTEHANGHNDIFTTVKPGNGLIDEEETCIVDKSNGFGNTSSWLSKVSDDSKLENGNGSTSCNANGHNGIFSTKKTENGHVADNGITDQSNGFGNLNGGFPKVSNDAKLQNGNALTARKARARKVMSVDVIKDLSPDDNYIPTVPKTRRDQNKLVVFFRDYYFKFATSIYTQALMLPLFLGVIVFFAYEASKLEPDNENIYKDDHHFSKASKSEQYRFLYSPAENLLKINIVWGLKENDRSDCHFSSIECYGENVYDESFDPNPVENQKALMDFCAVFDKMSPSEAGKFRIKVNPDTKKPEVACFTDHLNQYLQSKSLEIGTDLSLPWNYSHIEALMKAKPRHFDSSHFNESFPNILEIPVQYWLYNGYSLNYTTDYGLYNHLFGEQLGPWSRTLRSYPAVKYGNKLKYIIVEVNTTINRFTTGYNEGIPIIQRWEEFTTSQMSKMPKGLQGGFQVTRSKWHMMFVQKTLADNALLGIGVGVSLAFVILSLTTMNIIIGFFATLSIACTTVCVVGLIPLLGWKLGILVSLNMCMLVGLAVDYVVHLAEGYHLSLHSDRLNRTRDMLEEMATSVFSGACTTLGSSVFMLFTDIQFFMQFGVFLFCTIGFSLIFSIGMFTILMGLIGPENNTGSLTTLFKKCRNAKREETVEGIEYALDYD